MTSPNVILLYCNGFTEIQDIIKLIAHSPESTLKNVKYTVNMIQNSIKPNIKGFFFFSKHSKPFNVILLHCNGVTEFQDLIKFTVQIPHLIQELLKLLNANLIKS